MEELKTFQDLEGHILFDIEVKKDEIVFTIEGGDVYKLYHDQDCCETVEVEDVAGDPSLMIGEKILMAYESSSSEVGNKGDDSYTWTFYILRTNSESITIRFYGSSNGYYSEKVSWMKVKTGEVFEEEKEQMTIDYIQQLMEEIKKEGAGADTNILLYSEKDSIFCGVVNVVDDVILCSANRDSVQKSAKLCLLKYRLLRGKRCKN